MTIENLIHIMKNDYHFIFRIRFGMIKDTVELNTCKMFGNTKEKISNFMDMLCNNGFDRNYYDEDEETVFFNEDYSIVIRISD